MNSMNPLVSAAIDAARNGDVHAVALPARGAYRESQFLVTVYSEGEDGPVAVVLSESPDNIGCSVTMAIEDLASAVYSAHLDGIDPARVVWIENYWFSARPTFDLVRLEYVPSLYGPRFFNPRWTQYPASLAA